MEAETIPAVENGYNINNLNNQMLNSKGTSVLLVIVFHFHASLTVQAVEYSSIL